MRTRDTAPQSPARRRALACLAWSGAGIVWTVAGGVPRALGMAADPTPPAAPGAFSFVQVSDTHLGFHKEANPDVAATFRRAIADINAHPARPAFAVHTGDITHLSHADEFDLAQELFQELKVDRVHTVPGEHDALDDGLSAYMQRYGKDRNGTPWYSFDDHGVHFIGLSNVLDFKAGSLALLGADQLAWLKRDLASVAHSTPVVVLAHIPLWTVYAPWGWGTGDADQALALLRPYGSVTVLNGHIHQALQKIEGHVALHTALSTAYPQPAPGAAASPGPLVLPPGALGKALGTRRVSLVRGRHALATIDTPLER